MNTSSSTPGDLAAAQGAGEGGVERLHHPGGGVGGGDLLSGGHPRRDPQRVEPPEVDRVADVHHDHPGQLGVQLAGEVPPGGVGECQHHQVGALGAFTLRDRADPGGGSLGPQLIGELLGLVGVLVHQPHLVPAGQRPRGDLPAHGARADEGDDHNCRSFPTGLLVVPLTGLIGARPGSVKGAPNAVTQGIAGHPGRGRAAGGQPKISISLQALKREISPTEAISIRRTPTIRSQSLPRRKGPIMLIRLPFGASGFAPATDAKPVVTFTRPPAGRHERVKSPLLGIAATKALLGLTLAGGVVEAGYLRHDLHAGLVSGAELGAVAFAMSLAGALTERRRITRVARAVTDQAVALSAAGVPADQAVPRLLANRHADAVTVEVAKRHAVARKENLQTIQLLSRVSLLRGLL